MQKINRKIGNSTPVKTVLPEISVQNFAPVIMSGTATTVQISMQIGSMEA